jgi:YD repeat-containing protein
MKIAASQIFLLFVYVFISLPTSALEIAYYYRGETFDTLGQAEQAMRAAHANDSLSPRVDSLDQYDKVFDPTSGKSTYYYKINLPETIDANVDAEYWIKHDWPILTNEGEAIEMFVDWRTESPAPAYHCSRPTFNGWKPGIEAFYTSRPSWLSGYPAELNRFKLFFGKVANIGHYTEHGRLGDIGYPADPYFARVRCDWIGAGGESMARNFQSKAPGPSKFTVYICPDGYKHVSKSPPRGCTLVQVNDTIESDVGSALSYKPKICEVKKEGNPCSVSTGNKTQTETDYVLKQGGLRVQRYYSSQGLSDGFAGMGHRWRHNYSQRMDGYDAPAFVEYPVIKSSFYATPQTTCLNGWEEIKSQIYRGQVNDATASYRNGVCEIAQDARIVARLTIDNTFDGRKDLGSTTGIRDITLGNGQSYAFVEQGDSWQPLDPGRSALTQEASNWIFRTVSGAVESYATDGKLLSRRNTSGQTTSFDYDDQGRLATVTGPFGDLLTYHYDLSNRIIRITTPEGDLNYGYDAEGRLTQVTYLDGSERHYHYEDPNYAYLLTGITDENGDRYATWAYDSEGRAIRSEHAGNAERVEFTYNPEGTTTVTDAAGAERIYHFTVQQGQMKVDHIEGDRCTTCSAGGIQAYTYDSNGFVASKTDWNGNTTTYTRDSQGRELSRTEASGTPQARTITTTWDTSLNKPLTVTEPEQLTEYTYDAEGRLLSKKQSAIQ